MDVRRIVVDVLTQVAKDKGVGPIAWTDALPLGAQGAELERLDVAAAVAELRVEFGVDPFVEGRAVPATVGEFVACYEEELVVHG